jgi:hypothetical protein
MKNKKAENNQVLDYTGNTDHPIVNRTVNRLNSALQNQTIMHQMELEDELEYAFTMAEKNLKMALNLKDMAFKSRDEAMRKFQEERIKNELLEKKIANLELLLVQKLKK